MKKIIKYCCEKLEKCDEKIVNIKDYIARKINFDLKIVLAFAIIFILLYFQNNVVFMYFDDFGNASLSYAYWTPGVEGTNYTVPQLFEWAKAIYNNWGGRIFYAIAFIIPLLKNGIQNYMLIQTAVLTLTFVYMYKIVKLFYKKAFKSDNAKYLCVPIILAILYMCLDMLYLQNGVYWASASILYVWPILPFIALIYYYIKNCYKIELGQKVNYWFSIPQLIVLAFLTTFSQEQFGAGVLFFLISYICIHHLKKIKKYLILDIPIVITSIGSFLAILLAPGNTVRMSTNAEFDNLGFLGKIFLNFPKITQAIFADKMNIYMVVLTILMFVMIALILKKKWIVENKKKYLWLIVGVVCLIINGLLIVKNEDVNVQRNILAIFGTLWFILMFTTSIIYFKQRNILEIISIEFAAIGIIFCLLLSPVVGGRTGIPYIFLIMLLIVIISQEILNSKREIIKIILCMLFITLFILGTKKYINIYNGYKDNYAIHQLNFDLLNNYKLNESKSIELYKVRETWYGSAMPYDVPYMDFWIKEYFNISQEIEFKWIDIYESLR